MNLEKIPHKSFQDYALLSEVKDNVSTKYLLPNDS